MNKVFCSSCGHKNVYEVAKPKFCSACGAQIGVAAIDPAKIEAVAQIDYEEEGSSSFDLDALKRSIVSESSSQQVTLTDLWKSSTPEDASRDKFSRPASNLPNGEAMIKKSQSDCAPSRPTEIDG